LSHFIVAVDVFVLLCFLLSCVLVVLHLVHWAARALYEPKKKHSMVQKNNALRPHNFLLAKQKNIFDSKNSWLTCLIYKWYLTGGKSRQVNVLAQ